MPQLPSSSTDDLGADDEVKEYKQEEDENSSNGAHVDLVNDIKSDLIKRDAESSEPPPRCQQGSAKSPDASSAPIAQLISFQHRYNDQMFAPPPHGYPHHPSHMDEPKRMRSRSTSEIFHPGPYPTPSTPPYHHHVYPIKQERGYYEAIQWPHHGTPTPVIASVTSGYYPGYPAHGNITPPGMPRLAHPSHGPGHQGDMSRQPVASSMMHLPVTCGIPTSACSTITPSRSPTGSCKDGKKIQHVKKPLNAFMLYMREMRQKVISECTLKESAAINQILGRKWHSLDRAEQAKYYELARKERAIHMQMYPGWTARDNYAQGSKKKKRKRDKQGGDSEITNPKKCRARYGLDRQQDWCKPCRRKKKCIRFVSGNPNPQDISLEEGESVKEVSSSSTTENPPIPTSSSSTENNIASSPSSQDSQTQQQSCTTSIPHVPQTQPHSGT